MAMLSSHILDSVIGDHARQIRVVCVTQNREDAQIIFDAIADENGRISESIDVERFGGDIELQFYTAAYFLNTGHTQNQANPLEQVVVRLSLSDPQAQYHIPLVLSPHSYTFWWSGLSSS